MRILESRRLTGANLQNGGPGAITEVLFESSEKAEAINALWRSKVRALADKTSITVGAGIIRSFENGAAWFLPAPIDQLYAAVTLNEWVSQQIKAELSGAPPASLEVGVDAVEAQLAEERDPALIAMQQRASTEGVALATAQPAKPGNAGNTPRPMNWIGPHLNPYPWC